MCVYIVQYYAINLMFNSDGVAAFPCQGAKERLLQAPARPLPLSCLRQKQVLQQRESLDLGPTFSHSINAYVIRHIYCTYLFV